MLPAKLKEALRRQLLTAFAIRLELRPYPWIMVLLIDAVHSLSQRIDL